MTANLPVFPLHAVLFPGGELPFGLDVAQEEAGDASVPIGGQLHDDAADGDDDAEDRGVDAGERRDVERVARLDRAAEAALAAMRDDLERRVLGGTVAQPQRQGRGAPFGLRHPTVHTRKVV